MTGGNVKYLILNVKRMIEFVTDISKEFFILTF